MTGSENLFIIIVNAINNRLRMNLSSLRNVEINCIDLSDGGSFAGTLTLGYVGFRFDLELTWVDIRLYRGCNDRWLDEMVTIFFRLYVSHVLT